MTRPTVALLATVDAEKLGVLIAEYGQANYLAGVAQTPAFTLDEHHGRVEAASEIYRAILRELFRETRLDVTPPPTTAPADSYGACTGECIGAPGTLSPVASEVST